LQWFTACLQAHKVRTDTTTEDISSGSYTISEDSTGLNDEMQLLPENLPFLCCKTCLVVFKTHKEFELHVCKNGTNHLDEGTILVSSFSFSEQQMEVLNSIKPLA
jgi:hypothetical protein